MVTDRGKFCVIEGIDGSGKSTLMGMLRLKLNKIPSVFIPEYFTEAIYLREPTDLTYGQQIRKILREQGDPPRDEWLELFLRDREENVRTRILPGLATGALILQDRYFYSTAAYQGDFANPPSPLEILHQNRALHFPEPDLLVYLDISPERAMERIRAGRSGIESFESLERLRQIRENYEKVLPEKTLRLNAEQHSVEELADAFFRELRTLLP